MDLVFHDRLFSLSCFFDAQGWLNNFNFYAEFSHPIN